MRRFSWRRWQAPIARADRARDAAEWTVAGHYYKVALRRNPDLPDIWVQYGHALKESDNVAQAEAAYRRALTYEPTVADTHLQLGHALKLQGKTAEAQAAYLRAFVLDPLLPYPPQELSGLGWLPAELAELRSMLGGQIEDQPIDGCSSNVETAQAAEELSGGVDLPLGVTERLETHAPAVPETAIGGRAVAQDWSGDFDAKWYLNRYPDVARAGQDPLEHFLTHGIREGRKPNAAEARDVWDPVTQAKKVWDAEIYCLKPPSFRDEVALLLTHSPYGRLKPHVRHYLDSLRRQGIAVVLIVAADAPFTSADDNLVGGSDGIFVRQNQGYDFAGWAHILHLHPELFDAKILYLLNDSVIGPTNDRTFTDLLRRLRESPADVIGLTETCDRAWHIQSYFLALKPRALSCVALHKFINKIVSYEDKEDVINNLEIQFAPTLKAAGLECEALFRAKDTRDPTVFHWDDLLQSGFPFIKVKILREVFAGVDNRNWRELLAAQGYDVLLAEQTLIDANLVPVATNLSAPEVKKPLLSLAPIAHVSDNVKVAFIGPWNYDSGLGVGSRGYISALRHTGLSVNFHPIKRPFHVHQRIAPAVDMCDFTGSADVAIVHLNPDGWPGLLTEAETRIIEQAKVSIGLWVWEMAHIPENWFPAFDQVDAIWTPSRYCADIFSVRAGVPVERIPHVVALEPIAPADAGRVAGLRRGLSLSEDDRIILYAFDGASYLVRKNPLALVRSYARSGLATRGWRLVLKTKHLFDSHVEGVRLREEIDRTPGVVLMDQSVSKATMGELMRMADIYASPHCSEGFGLTIAEAMALGKVVVATDYGGSRDFLDPQCGFPVRYRMRSLDDDHGHYTRGGIWAQIDEEHLTDMLVEAAGLVAAGDLHIGDAARRRIADLLSPTTVAAKMQESLSRSLMRVC